MTRISVHGGFLCYRGCLCHIYLTRGERGTTLLWDEDLNLTTLLAQGRDLWLNCEEVDLEENAVSAVFASVFNNNEALDISMRFFFPSIRPCIASRRASISCVQRVWRRSRGGGRARKMNSFLNVEENLRVNWRTRPYPPTMYKVCKRRKTTQKAEFLLQKTGKHPKKRK